METYPKIKFHVRGGGSICVTSAEQEKALGGEWLDNKPFVAKAPILEQNVPIQEHQMGHHLKNAKVGKARA